MKWYLIRHGEMAGDPHAHMSPPVTGCLSAAGEQQAAALGEALAEVSFDAVWVSPLGRALQTAQALQRAPGVDFTVRDWLIEWRPAAQQDGTRATARFEDMCMAAAQLRPEQSWQTAAGEGALEMAVRIVPGWVADLARIGVQSGHGGYVLDDPEDMRNIAVVAHGGSLGVLLAFILGIPFQPYPPLQFALTGVAEITLTRRVDVWYPLLQLAAPGATR